MKFKALKECPQGQLPGEIFEATEDAGRVLVLVGAAEVYKEPEPSKSESRRTYNRRDLTAIES